MAWADDSGNEKCCGPWCVGLGRGDHEKERHWDNLGGKVLKTYKVLFQELAFRGNYTQMHLRRIWSCNLIRKRGIDKNPLTSSSCGASDLACAFPFRVDRLFRIVWSLPLPRASRSSWWDSRFFHERCWCYPWPAVASGRPGGGVDAGRRAEPRGKRSPWLQRPGPRLRRQRHVPRPVRKTIPRHERQPPSSCGGAPPLLTCGARGPGVAVAPTPDRPPLGAGAIGGDYRSPHAPSQRARKKIIKKEENLMQFSTCRSFLDLGKSPVTSSKPLGCKGPQAGSGPWDSGEIKNLELRWARPPTQPLGLCLTLGAKQPR